MDPQGGSGASLPAARTLGGRRVRACPLSFVFKCALLPKCVSRESAPAPSLSFSSAPCCPSASAAKVRLPPLFRFQVRLASSPSAPAPEVRSPLQPAEMPLLLPLHQLANRPPNRMDFQGFNLLSNAHLRFDKGRISPSS